MGPRGCLIAGVACLALAQGLASFVAKPMRQPLVANASVYDALQPGEFAGTLMLGGFRGLACDLLWMRAVGAKESSRHYESVALFQTISRIQPRFEQVWEYMAYDMAYNLAHEVEDREGKYAWFVTAMQAIAQGSRRNPGSVRLIKKMAEMFDQKGRDFTAEIEAASWSGIIDPILAAVAGRAADGRPAELIGDRRGLSNHRIAALLYAACVRMADADPGNRDCYRYPAHVRRMVPLALEQDGNLQRNRGDHREALRRYLAALRAWDEVRVWTERPGTGVDDLALAVEVYERNEGRLRRKAADLARALGTATGAAAGAETGAVGAATATAIDQRRWDEAETLIAGPGWNTAVPGRRIRWLDEP